MLILLRAKRILPLSSFTAHLLPRRCSSSSNFTVDYLISTFGFSPEKAARVYKPVAHLKSPEKPDSVIRFLNHQGFAESHIKKLITWYPRILCSSPEKTLEPNLRALRDIGLSNSTLTEIILSDPDILHISPSVSRVNFWKNFLGGREAALVTAFKNNRGLATQITAPKISLLQTRYGLSTHEIARISVTVPGFIVSSLRLMEDLLVRAKGLGFQPGLPMFVSGLQALMGNSREVLQKKMVFLKSFGWSEDDFFSALRKYPLMVKISEKNLKTKMDFLMGEAGCNLSYIVSNPLLLTCSLEKRLRPRHHVLRLLESKGLSSKEQGFCTAIKMSDNKFIERYILPHKEHISGLHETYLSACARESK